MFLKNEDVAGAAATGDAPTTSEWKTFLLPIKVRIMLEIWRYQMVQWVIVLLSPFNTYLNI